MAEKDDRRGEAKDATPAETSGNDEYVEAHLAVTEFIARFLRRDGDGRLVEDQPVLDMLLPMVLDMSVDTSVEQRLGIWVNMLKTDALQAAAYDGLIEGLVEKLHQNDPVLFERLLEPLDLEIMAKLERLSEELGTPHAFTEETLEIGNYDTEGWRNIIHKYFSHAQELYESIIVLLSCRQRITAAQAWGKIEKDLKEKHM